MIDMLQIQHYVDTLTLSRPMELSKMQVGQLYILKGHKL